MRHRRRTDIVAGEGCRPHDLTRDGRADAFAMACLELCRITTPVLACWGVSQNMRGGGGCLKIPIMSICLIVLPAIMSTNLKILITGGAGLIGTVASRLFKERGYSVTTLDLKPCDLDGNSVDHVCDTAGNLDVEMFANISGIVHLAAVSRVIDAENDPEKCTQTNLVGTERILKMATQAKCRWLVFGSSREVYGEQESMPVSETADLRPINHYGRIKVQGEKLVEQYCMANNINFSILRFSNVYGHPGDHATRLVNAFVRNAIAGKSLEIHGGGQVFDFTHCEDTGKAIVLAAKWLDTQEAPLPAMNVLPGKPTSIESLASIVINTVGNDVQPVVTSGRDYDVNRFYGSPKLMKERIGFGCHTDIKKGIELTVGSFMASSLNFC